RTISEEQKVIQALASSQSEVSEEILLQKLLSPKFYIRAEALNALRFLPVNDRIAEALINEVRNNTFTTAYIAAEIIGEKNIMQGKKVLRDALLTEDYLLCSKSMVALARIGDKKSIPKIERIMEETSNPRILIHGAYALDILFNTASIPLLLKILKQENPPPFLRDEIILSIAGILGMDEWFYPIYTTYLENQFEGLGILEDIITENEKTNTAFIPELHRISELLNGDKREFGRQIAKLFPLLPDRAVSGFSAETFSSAARDPQLSQFDRFCFLLNSLAVWLLWIKK
ncbi:MAG: HEAT repeat domain-containing protein, partial [Spirochaetota bacterium]